MSRSFCEKPRRKQFLEKYYRKLANKVLRATYNEEIIPDGNVYKKLTKITGWYHSPYSYKLKNQHMINKKKAKKIKCRQRIKRYNYSVKNVKEYKEENENEG